MARYKEILALILILLIVTFYELRGQVGLSDGVPVVLPTLAYASLYETDDACTSVIDTGAIGTFVGWTTASEDGSKDVVVDLVDALGDSLTIATTGVYAINFNAGFTGPAGKDLIFAVSVNGTPSNLRQYRTASVGSSRGAATLAGRLFSLSSGDVVRLEVDSDGANTMVSICSFSLAVNLADESP